MFLNEERPQHHQNTKIYDGVNNTALTHNPSVTSFSLIAIFHRLQWYKRAFKPLKCNTKAIKAGISSVSRIQRAQWHQRAYM